MNDTFILQHLRHIQIILSALAKDDYEYVSPILQTEMQAAERVNSRLLASMEQDRSKRDE